jgi:lysophospholipase L1-like esterase
MGKSRLLWRFIGLVSVIGTIILITGFIYAVKSVVFPSGGFVQEVVEERSFLGNEDSVEIVALGDSLTVGFGDSTGKGYVKGVQEKLSQNIEVPVYVVANFAQNGFTTSQIDADLDNRQGIQEAIRGADIILMTAGGNDLFQMGEEIEPSVFKERIPNAQSNLKRIFEKINSLNPNARVYYIGLYNPYIEYKDIRGTSLAVQDWNSAVFEVVEPYDNVTFVPTFDLFQQNIDRFLSSDNYHLNDEGYARVATRLTMLME